MPAPANPFVHLELHTGDRGRACDFYTRLFGWRARKTTVSSCSYLSLENGSGVEGGVVECSTEQPVWLPYVEVADLAATLDRSLALGAAVALEPREGPVGRRGVIVAPEGGEIALWEPRDSRATGDR